jgi:hypothetical protein
MTNRDIARQRLYNQHIARQTLKSPAELVKYMGAMQAQDYAGAKWAIGLRLQNGKDDAIEKAMAEGSIIRIHVLRPTWHFVTPADVSWMLELTAPRIMAASAPYHRASKLDKAVFKKSHDALTKALEGGKQLTRMEIKTALQNAGVATDDLRFIHLLMQAELEKIICSGGRQGKQFTYALFDDRVPKSDAITKDEALATLTQGYFISRGPATLQDFTWWSGLTAADAKRGLEIVKAELMNMTVDNREYWMGRDLPVMNNKAPITHLLPAFDEFAVAYSDRGAIVNPRYLKQAGHVIFNPLLVVNNQVAGTWKRIVNKNSADIALSPFCKLNKTQVNAVGAAQRRYRRFIS